MRILVVAATAAEVAPLSEAIGLDPFSINRLRHGRYSRHEVDLLVTGVGMVSTAAWCARTLAQDHYHLALNVGLCGAFDRTLALGSVVHVVSDRMPELGAEDGDGWLTVHDLGLAGRDDPPFRGGAIVSDASASNAVLARLPRVDGITVNTVHGREQTIAEVVRRHHPQVESMEGAGFMYACAASGIPYAQVRAVSNVVERRNRGAWQIGPAIQALTETTVAILESA